MSAIIQFDEAAHKYRVNGVRTPSVTEILKPLYSDLRFVQKDLLDYASERGKAVHKAVELHVLGGLDYGSLSGDVALYFDQYLDFEAETGFKAVLSEALVASKMGYAGTLDLAGHMRGKFALVDLKTTATLSLAVALQTAAYQKAANESTEHNIECRFALRVSPKKHDLYPYTKDQQDFASFLGFLSVHRWCAANKKTITTEVEKNEF